MIAAIVQARVGSSRLPNKVLLKLCGQPLLWHIVMRLKQSKYLDRIIIATTTNQSDDLIENWAINNNISYYRGSESDVLLRYYNAADQYNVKTIIRITADDPFKDPKIMDQVIELYLKEDVDVACNNYPPTFPEGLDIEVFSFDALKKANREALEEFDREHVTQYFYKHTDLFSIINHSNTDNLSFYRWTIDEQNDLDMAREVYSKLFNSGEIFYMKDIIELLNNNQYIAEINSNVKRSSLYK